VRRTTRRRLTQGTLYAILLGILAALAFVADWAAIKDNFLDGDVARALWPEIVTVAAKNTVIYTVISFFGGLVLALVLALARLSTIGPYRWLATAYIEFFRGLPALLVIIASAVAIPIAFGWRPPGGTIGAGLAALIVVSSAYMAETLRAGIQAVPKGQTEAARSLGMSGGQAMRKVIVPQAIRKVIPPLLNDFIALMKDTSLVGVIALVEVVKAGREVQAETFNSSALTLGALMFVIVTIPLARIVDRLIARQQLATRRTAP